MIGEILVLLALTLVNGGLAMSELAVVSSRPARLRAMADGGSRGAAIALRLAEDPGRFLSSVQIGITLVGILAGALSGATLGLRAAAALQAAGLGASMANALGVGGVVILITYVSLVLGELVPKQIALRAPERVAARAAPVLNVVAIVAAPLVWLLDRSGKLVLGLLGQSGTPEPSMTDDEIRLVLSEARSAGVMEPAETEMIAGVMRIADRTARGLMTPRRDVDIVDLDETPAAIAARFRDTQRSRLPVRDGGEDEIIGIFAARDFLDTDVLSGDRDLRTLIRAAPVVRDGLPALDVIDAMRKAPAHMLLVYDEYGHFEGIVTPMNLLEAITGDFDGDNEPDLVEREDGSFLVAGAMPVDEFAERFGVPLPDSRDFATVAGLVIDHAGMLPPAGAVLRIGPLRIEIVDLDGRRIDRILVSKDAPGR